MTTTPLATGRGYLIAGVGVTLLGLALVLAQIALKYLFTPWYAPALATLGALLLVVAVRRRPGVVRIAALVLFVALACFEWFFLVTLMKLPAYEGPARAGQPLPAFAAARADGRPFTDADLRDGSRRAMVFFRGRW